RIARESVRRRKILSAVVLPQPAVAAKGRDPAVGGDSGAGQHDDLARLLLPDRLDCRLQHLHRSEDTSVGQVVYEAWKFTVLAAREFAVRLNTRRGMDAPG